MTTCIEGRPEPPRGAWGALRGPPELFLEPNFQPGGAGLERTLAQLEALAPKT